MHFFFDMCPKSLQLAAFFKVLISSVHEMHYFCLTLHFTSKIVFHEGIRPQNINHR